MENNNLQSKVDIINTHIYNGELNRSFAQTRQLFNPRTPVAIKDLLERQESTYKYMLHYMMEGYADASRDKLLAEIKSSLQFILDSIVREDELQFSSDIYMSTVRYIRHKDIRIEDVIENVKRHLSEASLLSEAGNETSIWNAYDESLVSLFNYVWTMFGASKESYSTLLNYIKDSECRFEIRAQIISALLLGNRKYFDRKGFELLLDIYDAEIDNKTTARALIAVTLVLSAHPDRISSDPSLNDRMTIWADNIMLYRRMREVVMSIMKARDTKRISDKMQNDVLPELMKLRPDILKKMRNMSESNDIDMLEMNPEWEEILNKNGLGDKLKELTDMQMEGGDVMMMAFSNLKSFPFFNDAPNWLLPFSASHHLVSDLNLNSSAINTILEIDGVMCDSDKYSFVFSLANMPEAQRKMMTQRMDEQIAQLKEAMADRKLKSSVPEFDSEVTRYIRDLYRFFKLFRKKENFTDPFETPFEFLSLPYIGEVMRDSEIIRLAGEFYFKRGYYSESLPFLLHLQNSDNQDSHLWEKIGYCYSMTFDLEKALEWYLKAELISPDSIWLICQIAHCYRLAGNYSDAYEYYGKALEFSPDDYKLLINAANCLMESERPQDALKFLYHADYIKPDKYQTKRLLAWCELLCGSPDKSLGFYERILSEGSPTATDHLNAGHAYFLKKEYRKAASLYKQAIAMSDYDIEKLSQDVANDSTYLARLGADVAVLKLMIETIRYDI